MTRFHDLLAAEIHDAERRALPRAGADHAPARADSSPANRLISWPREETPSFG